MSFPSYLQEIYKNIILLDYEMRSLTLTKEYALKSTWKESLRRRMDLRRTQSKNDLVKYDHLLKIEAIE
jgi:hypothetical protein